MCFVIRSQTGRILLLGPRKRQFILCKSITSLWITWKAAEVVNISYFSKKEGKTKETKHVAHKSIISSKYQAFLSVTILIDTTAMPLWTKHSTVRPKQMMHIDDSMYHVDCYYSKHTENAWNTVVLLKYCKMFLSCFVLSF